MNQSPNGRGRFVTVLVLIGALVASSLARSSAVRARRSTLTTSAAGSTTSLSSMDSYALALLLGGLRGPLVMFLWPSSEMQKSDRNLEDFDTKIEWIRLLQAEFDSVHIFQVWNKAYNISVQMANVSNKYTTILDALEYAHSVLQERPNNINMLAAIGGLYFDKFGLSAERNFYKERVREQTLPHETRTRRDAAGIRRAIELPAMLDADGKVLDQYLRPSGPLLTVKYEKPELAEQDKTPQTYDGSELQYLPRFAPYRDGLSPFALAYNYFKRAQIVQQAGKQRHLQLSEMVVDSRPALALRNWAEDEWRTGRRWEMRAANVPVPEDEADFEQPTTTAFKPDTTPTAEQIPWVQKAARAYDMAARLAPAGDDEYVRHTVINNYAVNLRLYQEHRDILRSEGLLCVGDRDYLLALLESDPARRKALLASSADAYRKAMDEYTRMILRYHTPEELAAAIYPPGTNRETVEKIPADVREQLGAQVVREAKAGKLPESAEAIADCVRPFTRAQVRVQMIESMK